MSSLTTLFFNFLNPRKPMLWILFAVILLLSAAVYGYYNFYLAGTSNKLFNNVSNEGFENGGKIVTIYFFHADWCPHCKKAQPEWDNFYSNYNGQSINDYTVNLVDVNCTDETDKQVKEYISEYNIQGYPTVKMVKEDKVIDFDANVKSQSLQQFLNDMLK
jgi:thiol-disulfide isomerase/thioredoxin